jgi:hypothetical protein
MFELNYSPRFGGMSQAPPTYFLHASSNLSAANHKVIETRNAVCCCPRRGKVFLTYRTTHLGEQN